MREDIVHIACMPEDRPLELSEVLEQEYRALGRDLGALTAAEEPERSAEAFRRIHQQAPLSALCISGGGIRSATFALGAIGALADKGVLNRFDYLSTVSGGGYIGSWLTAWIQRAQGVENIIPHLKKAGKPPAAPLPDPVQHLREYNNYLTPKLGVLSADTWTLVATVLRNMLLNWLVLIPLLMGALMAPRFAVSLVNFRNLHEYLLPAGTWLQLDLAAHYLGFAFFAFAMFNMIRYLPGVGDRPHSQKAFIRFVLAPVVLATICQSVWWTWDNTEVMIPTAEAFQHNLLQCFAGWGAYLLYSLISGDGRAKLPRLLLPISFAVLLVGLFSAISYLAIFNFLYELSPENSIFVVLEPPLLLAGMLLGGCLFVGLTSVALKDEDREWMSRAGALLLLFAVGWLGIGALVLIAPDYMQHLNGWIKSAIAGAGGLAGIITAAAGSSGKSRAQSGNQEAAPAASGKGSRTVELALKLAPPAFMLLLIVGLSLLTDVLLSSLLKSFHKTSYPWWDHRDIVEKTLPHFNLILAAGFFLLSFFMARFVNINRFSLHAMYRNRLIRAYLGASNPLRTKDASLFTGFSESDNLHMQALDTRYRPMHVVNACLNLVAGDRLAWQQRKAQSFTITPLHCGSYDLGYRDTGKYGGDKGITLGTAVTISGAAASPNMGYHSSPVISFIMTLFNARLGSWLGNPGAHGVKTWEEDGPRSAIGSLVREGFGLTNNRSPYVYLSDGGHFENLGLYEMVLRRCRYIVVLDSGCDPSFTYEDLGNALRKIRIDLNIPIEFDNQLISGLRGLKKRAALARIDYPSVDGPTAQCGYILYLKPMVLRNESPDVLSYHSGCQAFPHESTADQWYTESQTESYRMLGWHSVQEAMAGFEGGAFEDLFRHVASTYLEAPQALALSAQASRGALRPDK